MFNIDLWSLFMLEWIFNIKFLVLELNEKNDLVVNCGPDLSEIDNMHTTDNFIILFYHILTIQFEYKENHYLNNKNYLNYRYFIQKMLSTELERLILSYIFHIFCNIYT